MSAPTEVRHPARWRDLGLALLGAAVLLLSGLFALDDAVAAWEREAFRLVNGLPLSLPLVWPVMQLGTYLAVLLVALVAAVVRRFRLAAEVLVSGTLAYVLAKVLKDLVDRGRPGELLEDVVLHGASSAGRGFPSGHVAVATAVVVLVLPHLGRRGRQLSVLCVVLVGLARLWVGAHLPLDVIGGAALGIVAAAGVRAVAGRTTGP